ncbi:MAG: efflux RND transporter permease subunit, partial [Planctomycetota bacterium]
MNLRERLPEFALDRPVSVLMLFVALLVVGVLAWMRIPLQMMPSGFDPGFLGVWIAYPNASPQEIDEQIVTPLQEQLSTVSGIRHTFSNARTSSMFLGMEFYASADMDEAYNEVSDRLERALLDMPDDVPHWGVWRYNPADQPIVWAGAQMPEDIDDPYYVLNSVVEPRLARIDGVADVDTWGAPRRSVY